jgi:hypothetical protein
MNVVEQFVNVMQTAQKHANFVEFDILICQIQKGSVKRAVREYSASVRYGNTYAEVFQKIGGGYVLVYREGNQINVMVHLSEKFGKEVIERLKNA